MCEIKALLESLPIRLRPIASMALNTLPIEDLVINTGNMINDITGKMYLGFSLSQPEHNVRGFCANKVFVAGDSDMIYLRTCFMDGKPPDVYSSIECTTEEVVDLIHIAMVPRENMV